MSARYILRLDDASPTMRREIWHPLEKVLDELGIKPLVGVIPDSRDPSLLCSPADADFWSRVRMWQSKEWDIALHGLHHVYHPIPSDGRPILNLAKQSEFVGLSLQEQKQKLMTGYRLMEAERVCPRIFMAPSHTFDSNTLQALQEATDIRCIADGHSFRSYNFEGFAWIPQQLWRFRKMPFGIWCICLHPNTMNASDLEILSLELRRHSTRFINASTALKVAKSSTLLDNLFSIFYRLALKIKRSKKNV